MPSDTSTEDKNENQTNIRSKYCDLKKKNFFFTLKENCNHDLPMWCPDWVLKPHRQNRGGSIIIGVPMKYGSGFLVLSGWNTWECLKIMFWQQVWYEHFEHFRYWLWKKEKTYLNNKVHNRSKKDFPMHSHQSPKLFLTNGFNGLQKSTPFEKLDYNSITWAWDITQIHFSFIEGAKSQENCQRKRNSIGECVYEGKFSKWEEETY